MHRNDIALDAFTSASIFFRKMLFEMDIVRLNINIEYDWVYLTQKNID